LERKRILKRSAHAITEHYCNAVPDDMKPTKADLAKYSTKELAEFGKEAVSTVLPAHIARTVDVVAQVSALWAAVDSSSPEEIKAALADIGRVLNHNCTLTAGVAIRWYEQGCLWCAHRREESRRRDLSCVALHLPSAFRGDGGSHGCTEARGWRG